MQSNNPSLAAVWWPGTRHNHISRAVLLAVCGFFVADFFGKVLSAILAGADDHANFRVLTLGMLYGWRHATAAVLLYLGEGAVGLSVFAGGGGMAYMAGPTGGYLFGFSCRRRRRRFYGRARHG